MWLLYRVLILTAFFASMGQAYAQAQQQPVLPAPSDAALAPQVPMQFSAPQLAPAPTIQPLLSPRDQAAKNNREAAEAAAAQQVMQQNSTVPAAQAVAAQQGFVAPQQPIIAPAQQPIGLQQQPQPQQQAIIAPPQESPAATPSITPVESAAAQPQAPAQATVSQSFSTPNTPDDIRAATGMMPITNPGIDMNLQPNIVGGGVDPATGGTMDAVPYEIQLQQRTLELQQQARGMAFEQAKRSALAMEPYEIRDVLNRLKDTQEAIQTPARPAPKPGNVIKTVSTDPGVKPHTIHLAAGNVSTINIIDITGEPWPILDVGFGGQFFVNPPEPGGHVIRITPKKDFARGNMVVRLMKVTTPITFTLEAGGETVDYRFDARIPELGPNAKTPVIDEGIGMMAGDKITTSILEGAPPTGAEKVVVTGADGRTSAYRYSSSLYVRTPLSLLSPAWQGSATSSDGMNVYVLEDTPVLLLSDKGTLVRARMEQKTSNTLSTSKE